MTTADGYVGRLAPSPTGLLHLGHAATFLRAAERARVAEGRLLLRVDDLDRERVREEFVGAMLTDLSWLGLRWEEPVVTQSERLPLPRAAMEQLLAMAAVYPCVCSRRDLAGMLSAPHEGVEDEPVYAGRCRPGDGSTGFPATPRFEGEDGDVGTEEPLRQGLREGVNYRFRVPDGERVEFEDGNYGAQGFVCGCEQGADFGDFLVWRRDGLPSYQLACVVDDAAMGVTEVVRGRDLLKSTARQILLQRALGLRTPAYFHTQLRVDAAGTRLAKRHDALAIRTLRERGMQAEEVCELARGSAPKSHPD